MRAGKERLGKETGTYLESYRANKFKKDKRTKGKKDKKLEAPNLSGLVSRKTVIQRRREREADLHICVRLGSRL